MQGALQGVPPFWATTLLTSRTADRHFEAPQKSSVHPSSLLHSSSLIPHPSSLSLHFSFFIPHPSSTPFILHPSSFTSSFNPRPHYSSHILHPSFLTLHLSSSILYWLFPVLFFPLILPLIDFHSLVWPRHPRQGIASQESVILLPCA